LIDEYLEYLNKFFVKLYDNLEIKKKLKNKSVLLSILYISKNDRHNILNSSSISYERIPEGMLDYLLSDGYIRETDKLNNYAITAKGCWEIELHKEQISIEDLIKNIDNNFFNLSKEVKSLSEKEKIIILSMISVRSFSEQCAIDLQKGGIARNKIEDLISETYGILRKQKIINKLSKDDLFGKAGLIGNEPSVSNLFRHADISIKTKGIYKNPGNRKYYLNLYKNSLVSIQDLSFLFWLIYGNNMTIEMKKEVYDFCLRNTYEKSIYLFESNERKFAKPDYDDIMKEALEDYFISRKKW